MELPLIEKYRPHKFEDVVGFNTAFINLTKDPATMPNLLFHGAQGTGKTTVAKIIIENLKPISVMRINGSDTTGVDTIREKVFNFMSGMSSVPNKPKIIWIEEFDFMSPNAFAALRSMMEQYMANTRFICTCNYINKIPEPIQSRFSMFEFKKSTDYQEIEHRLIQICEAEEITTEDDTILIDLIVKHLGDIRATINELQVLSTNDEKKVHRSDLMAPSGILDELYALLMNSDWSKIRYDMPAKIDDYPNILVMLEKKFFDDDNITITIKAEITEIISHGLFEMNFLSFNQDICFAAICAKIIKMLGDTK